MQSKRDFGVYCWGTILLVFSVLLLSSSISALVIPEHFIEPTLDLDGPALGRAKMMVRLASLPFLGLGLWLFTKLKLRMLYIAGAVLVSLLTVFYIFVVV